GRRRCVGPSQRYTKVLPVPLSNCLGLGPRDLISFIPYVFPKHMPARGIRHMNTTERQLPAPLELRSFLERIPTMAWSALPDGSLDFCNQPFRDYVRLSPDQLYHLGWKSAVHREDIQQLEAWWQNLRQSEEAGTTEVRLRRFDGSPRWFLIFANP